jgi:hypothetical protein
MFDNLKNTIKDKFEEWQKNNSIVIDTEIFNDPKAKLTHWHPLSPGGSNFKTNNLVKVSQMLYKYTLSTQAKLFIGLFFVIGVLASLGGIALATQDTAGWGLLAFGVIFTGASFLIYRFMAMPVIFDYSLGFIWKGSKPPKLSGNQQESATLVYFTDIYALQIIKERVRSKNSSYYSYELNLILKDNSRFALIDHGHIEQIRKDAENLSAFLGKPIWDATI